MRLPGQNRVLLLALTLSLLSSGAVAVRGENPRTVVVMTQNIYQGTELEHVVAARTLNEFLFGVATDYANVVRTNFAERAAAMAAEIAQHPAALIGLQEVALWRTGPTAFPPAPPIPATNVSYDFLQILLQALAARGLHYVPVATQANWDAQGTGVFPAGFMDVRLTERSAIIARADLSADELKVSNVHAAAYADATSIPIFGGGLFTLRGSWISLDAKVRGKTFRFITTHLDPISPEIRAMQVHELLVGPANTDLPVVLTGDLNSTTSTAAYAMLMTAGFVDGWLAANQGEPGLTCCQVPPDSIVNPTSQLYERVDYVLTRGRFDVSENRLVGADPTERTPTGLWPSDHAGLVTTLGIEPKRGGER